MIWPSMEKYGRGSSGVMPVTLKRLLFASASNLYPNKYLSDRCDSGGVKNALHSS